MEEIKKGVVSKGMVSCVITTRNRLPLLKRAVESVMQQTYSNIEIVVVDDGSDDGTKEWAESQNFKYIHIPKGKGKGGNYARNLGIKNSTGEFVAFLDDDDYWLPEKTELQVALFTDPTVGVVFGKRIDEIIYEDGHIIRKNCDIDLSAKGDLSKYILQRIPTSTSLIMVRKSLLEEVDYFDEQLGFWQEYELLIRLAQITKFDYVNKSVTVYTINKGDSNRLTNKYYGWKNAVRYIHDKHKNLYSRLNWEERLGAKGLEWGDAAIRCKNSGMKFKALSFKAVCYPWRIFRLLRSGNMLKKIKERFLK